MTAFRPWIVGAACAAVVLAASAQTKGERSDFGKREFEARCASCHGNGGKGDGPVTPFLSKSPPDLTLLARRNGGIFPISRLYDVVEGGAVGSHGTREMPVWGREYRMQAAEYYGEVPYDPEAYTRARLLALLEYVNRLQVK